MKLSKRETIMVVVLVFVVFIAGFWFLLLAPARANLAAVQLDYASIKQVNDSNQAIIDSVPTLKATRDALVTNVSDIEKQLLPSLKNEVITEHLATIFEKNGLPYITLISCDPVVTEQFQHIDNTISEDSVQWVRVNMKISGTDGITEGGIPAVGYKEFITAVKEIETANPDTIHVYSISMEDTEQGFQYFLISVDVFAFNLPNRISAIDPTEPYISWARDPVVSGGVFGIPYASIPPSQISAGFFKPFAPAQLTGGNPGTNAGANTAAPTPTP
ncbi:MAG: hypothetical protein WCG21_08365 [Eubacteriales bacterium]